MYVKLVYGIKWKSNIITLKLKVTKHLSFVLYNTSIV